MKTALYEEHENLGAQIVDFCGWQMPLKYEGVIAEHMAVRNNVGIFDVSHMGRVEVEGPQAEEFLNYLSTNIISGKKDFSATYTVWADETGGSVDDVIIFRIDAERFFVVVNAGNRDKDLAHMKQHAANFDVRIRDRFQEEGILAVQGEKAEELVKGIFPGAEDLGFMCFMPVEWGGAQFYLAKAGYTGSPGFELYVPNTVIAQLWNTFLGEGKAYGIQPVGLAARDTLRLEMGFALYGHELSDSIAPNESVASWAVKLKKDKFLGKDALAKKAEASDKRKQYGVLLLDKGVAREGYSVLKDGEVIGTVTSGTQSPCLQQGIAIVLVQASLKAGDQVEIQIRQRLVKAEVVKLPFWKAEK